MILLSKELLSGVLGKDVNQVVFDLKTIHYKIRSDVKKSEFVAYYDNVWNVLNIYELAHKCKEYIIKNNYSLYIMHDTCGLDCRVILYKKSVKKYFYENTEPEALFLACEWILKETK